jgi:hypothetical protein
MRATLFLAVLSLVACAQDPGEVPADAGFVSGDAGGEPGDAGEQLVGDDYSAGMEKTSQNGHFRLALMSSDPIPQDLTDYTWVMELRDAQGEAIDGATLVAEPFMPEHGHGTFPRTTDGVPNGQPGQFTLSDLDLFMAGTWKVELRIAAGDLSDTVFYYFTLDG